MNMRRILIMGLILSVAALSVPVANLILGVPVKADYTALPASTPSLARAKEILGAKCIMCHSEDPALPFYAKLPVASSLIGKHIVAGTAIHDIHDLIAAEGRREIDLAKLEQSIELNTMPILPFMLAHWDGALTEEEKRDLLGWIGEVRAQAFATSLASPRFAAHAVQPLPAQWHEPLSPRKVVFGEKLYNDKCLSGDDTVSCASCHDLAKGGTDQLQFSVGVRGQVGGINAPTVFNAASLLSKIAP